MSDAYIWITAEKVISMTDSFCVYFNDQTGTISDLNRQIRDAGGYPDIFWEMNIVGNILGMSTMSDDGRVFIAVETLKVLERVSPRDVDNHILILRHTLDDLAQRDPGETPVKKTPWLSYLIYAVVGAALGNGAASLFLMFS